MRTAIAIAALASTVAALPPQTNSFWTGTETWSPLIAEQNGTMAVQALIERRFPTEFQNIFDLNLDYSIQTNASCNDAYHVKVTQPSGRIQVNASSTAGLAKGVLTYMRTRGGDMVWTGTTFTTQMLQQSLDQSGEWQGCSWVPWRYFLQTVTFSYETAFWDWPQWEYLIDWMSFHGINLPLAIGGQEMIWAAVYRDFGMSQEDIQNYFTGPAYLAWNRLGNLHGSWSNQQLSMDWIGKQWVLQKQIISRMVALGMTPVLPAFNGFIPEQLYQFVGGSQPYKTSAWADFPGEYTYTSALDPTWDSFKTVQTAFLQKQQQMYGGWTSGYYSLDFFNDIKPQYSAPDYLSAHTSNVIQSLKNVDPNAKWVMSGRPFVNDTDTWNETTINGLLSGADEDDLIVLDITSEAQPVWDKTNSFYGKKWIWNLQMNYGGSQGMFGSMWHDADEVIRAKENSTSLVGVGLTPEGFDNNELVYQMVLDTPWQTTPIDPIPWTKLFITRRYGIGLPGMANGTQSIMTAWTGILPLAYNNSDPEITGIPRSIAGLVPAVEGLINRTGNLPTKLPYANRDLVTACNNLLAAAFNAPTMVQIPHYQYDMVVCTRQVLLNVGSIIYQQMLTEWAKTTNATGMSELGDLLLEIIEDNDRVQAVNKNMLFATEVGNARKWSDDPAEQDFYESQFRSQITSFGPAPNSTVAWPRDRYAAKQYAGVLGGFDKGSWSILVQYLKQTPPSKYNQTWVDLQVREYEMDWNQQTWGTHANETWTTSSEDLLSLIAYLRPKWGNWLQASPP